MLAKEKIKDYLFSVIKFNNCRNAYNLIRVGKAIKYNEKCIKGI